MIRLIVKEENATLAAPYRIVSMENTTEWRVGERLTKAELDRILLRSGTRKVKLVIK